MNSQIQALIQNLHCTEEEARQVLEDDKKIDRGEKMPFDLLPEVEKQAKKYANAGTRRVNAVKTEKKRKENPVKASIIAEIASFLTEKGYKSVEIINKERQIALKVGETSYELTLIEKRKKG